MGKIYTAIGLMSGTSMDGVDLSVIRSDGEYEYTHILDKYFEYDEKLHKKLVNLRGQIFTQKDLIKFSEELKILEREITIFHIKIVKEIETKYRDKIDFYYNEGINTIILDLQQMEYMNSSGLGVFISILTQTRNRNGEVFVVNIPKKINQLLVITKLSNVFNIALSIDDAKDMIKSSKQILEP